MGLENVEECVREFGRKGYLLVREALPADHRAALTDALKRVEAEHPARTVPGNTMFESLHAWGEPFERLIDPPSVIGFFEALLGDCHILEMLAFVTGAGDTARALHWHHDGPLFHPRPADVPWDDRVPYPSYIAMAMYYLTDVGADDGPTQILPGSHKSGRKPERDDARFGGASPLTIEARAGDCLIYDSQLWHRGLPHKGPGRRLALLVPYARKFVAQQFYPYLDYRMPQDLLDRSSPRRQRLLGRHDFNIIGRRLPPY